MNPERNTFTWFAGFVLVLVVVGLALFVDSIYRGLKWMVTQWRLFVPAVLSGAVMLVSAAVIGPNAPTHVVVGTWLLTMSSLALGLWVGLRIVDVLEPRLTEWRDRRRPIHAQHELLDRMEQLR